MTDALAPLAEIGERLGTGAADELKRVGTDLAIDRVVSVEGVPGEAVIALAKEGDVIAEAAGDDIVADAADEGVGALVAVEIERDLAGGELARIDDVVA